MSNEKTALDLDELRTLVEPALRWVKYGSAFDPHCNDAKMLIERVPALLSEMERIHTNADLLSCSTMGEAFDRLEELLTVERELATAREVARSNKAVTEGYAAELAKVTAELKTLRADNEWYHEKWAAICNQRNDYSYRLDDAQRDLKAAREQAEQAQAVVANLRRQTIWLLGFYHLTEHGEAGTTSRNCTDARCIGAIHALDAVTPAAEPQADVQPCGCRTLTPQLHRPDCPDRERVDPLRDMKWVRRAAAPKADEPKPTTGTDDPWAGLPERICPTCKHERSWHCNGNGASTAGCEKGDCLCPVSQDAIDEVVPLPVAAPDLADTCPRCGHATAKHWPDDERKQPGCHASDHALAGCLCSYNPDEIARALKPVPAGGGGNEVTA